MATRSTKGRAKSRARSAAKSAKKSTRKTMSAAKKAATASARSASSKRRGATASSRARKTAKTVSRKRQPVTAVLTSITETVRESPVDRVARVATEVAQQATHAVSEGVDALKELGANLVDRVGRP